MYPTKTDLTTTITPNLNYIITLYFITNLTAFNK
jgi:hypothetical protein